MTLSRQGNNLQNGYTRPDLYSTNVLAPFYEESIANKITNNMYLNELKAAYGEKVYVLKRPAVKLQDHVIGAPREWSDIIDERTYFELSYIKTVSAKISKIDKDRNIVDVMSEVKAEVVEQMKEHVDTAVIVGAPASATTTHDCDTTWKTAGSATKDVFLASAKLDNLKVPKQNRFLLLDPVSIAYLKAEETLWARNAGTAMSPFKTGQIGTLLDGMEVYSSSYVAYDGTGAGTDGNQMIGMMGHRSAITLAVVMSEKFEYFDKLENYPESEGMGAMLVYGYGVVRPDALVAFKPLW